MQNHAQGLARQIGIFVTRTHLAVLLGLILLALSSTVRGQVSTASVNGVIRDPQGAVIPGATILLRSVETSVQHTSVSNNAGEYVILNITPGRYTIQASSKGFNPEKTGEFVLAVDQIATFDFSLKVGSETQVVAVEASEVQLNVTSANLGTVIETKQVNDLPLDGRNFTSLLSLTPGVAHHGGAKCGNAKRRRFWRCCCHRLGLHLSRYQRTDRPQQLLSDGRIVQLRDD